MDGLGLEGCGGGLHVAHLAKGRRYELVARLLPALVFVTGFGIIFGLGNAIIVHSVFNKRTFFSTCYDLVKWRARG